MSHTEHRKLARETPVSCAVITVSDTRTAKTDQSGTFIRARLAENGHTVSEYLILPDDPEMIKPAIRAAAQTVEVIILNGGTGISHRDRSFEAVNSLLEKTLPGFGELFRILSYEEIGPAAMLTRAIAGTFQNTLIFSLPGSFNAVRLGMDKLISPEIQHMVWEIIRQHGPSNGN